MPHGCGRTFGGMNKPSAESIAAVTLGSFMTYAGISHLTFKRDEFQAQVPNWFPIPADPVVLGSGVAEIGLGLGLLTQPKKRPLFGRALAAFYTVIYPGNIGQYAERKNGFHLDTDRARFIRLLFQPLLIVGALRAAGLPQKK